MQPFLPGHFTLEIWRTAAATSYQQIVTQIPLEQANASCLYRNSLLNYFNFYEFYIATYQIIENKSQSPLSHTFPGPAF